jgi:hypothetical protein
VRVLEIGKVWLDCPPKGDISDWLARGGTPEALYEIVDRLLDWTPEQAKEIPLVPLLCSFPIDGAASIRLPRHSRAMRIPTPNSNGLRCCGVRSRDAPMPASGSFITHASGAEAGNVDSARGGTALIGVARIVSTLFRMMAEEAERMLEDASKRHLYLRFDDAKANQSLVAFAARWFEKKTITHDDAGAGAAGAR